MSVTDTITLERRDGGVYLVGNWPEETFVSDELLATLDPQVGSFDGERLRLTLANAEAIYVLMPTTFHENIRQTRRFARLTARREREP